MHKLQESGEMYLETILILTNRMNYVRSIDVVEYMGYSKPSVSRAVNLLKSEDYITIDKDGYIRLTPTGREIAERIYARHELLTRVLNAIGVEEPVASDEACRIEHVIDDDTYNKINAFYEKFMKEQA